MLITELLDIYRIIKNRVNITDAELEDIQHSAESVGRFWGTLLVEKDILSWAQFAESIHEAYGIESVDLVKVSLQDHLIDMVGFEFIRDKRVCPISEVDGSIIIGMVDPFDEDAEREIRERLNRDVVIKIISEKQFYEIVIVRISTQDEVVSLIDEIENAAQMDNFMLDHTGTNITSDIAENVRENPTVKLVDQLIQKSYLAKASDIHFEPQEDKMIVRLRVDGHMFQFMELPESLSELVTSRLKIISDLDISETRRPQDGRFSFMVEGRRIDARISIFPIALGENVVIRILDDSRGIQSFNELGFDDHLVENFRSVVRKPYGILLVVGPTGSGKTTTLYSALNEINNVQRNIMTIEDPIEYNLPLIRQSQVNEKAGVTFASGLRSLMRQDPDVIMVGEIRDHTTAEVAIQASLTGHLVFSTLHTNNASSTLARLINMEVEPFLVATSIEGILAQRLLRTICKTCKKQIPKAEAHFIDSFEKEHGSLDAQHLYVGEGCHDCKGTGYSGRTGVFELLVMSDPVRELLFNGANSMEIEKVAKENGMRTMLDDGLNKVINGDTTIEELMTVVKVS